ncbi:hypothetical protein ONZ51_g11426 [Trametes cubensis]|uniref:SUN domain-containing protein n=1 Tax=Trametes cubensis TaxID=1111947 RepID=A0AAD7X5G0_9APHY|nr:hypothetical protein ONZ51_g11426 [Trametes cubensis]
MSGGVSPFDPSRFVYEEPPKRVPAGGKTVRFEHGEPSFSEQVTRTHHVRHHGAPRAPRIHREFSTNVFAAGGLFILVLALLYAPLPFLDRPITHTGAPSLLQSGRKLLTEVWDPARSGPASSCTYPLDSARDLAKDAAFIARWGPVLHPDYALRANGGRIVSSLTSSPKGLRSTLPIPTPEPEVVIDEDMSIGRCWTTAVSGQLGISTSVLIHPRNITIDHIPRQIALDIDRAPRHMVLWGVIDGLSNIQRFCSLLTDGPEAEVLLERGPRGQTYPPLTGNHAFIALATFEYDISLESPTQTFAVFKVVATSDMDFGIFVLEVLDNWGAQDTCLYRVRIHGEPAEVQSQVVQKR